MREIYVYMQALFLKTPQEQLAEMPLFSYFKEFLFL